MSDKIQEEMITISKHLYKHLLDRDEWLDCLEAAGVDNWEGFDVANKIYLESNSQANQQKDDE